MAITDVAEYAHLSVEDLAAFAADLEAIRSDVEDSRGAKTGPISVAPSLCSVASRSPRAS